MKIPHSTYRLQFNSSFNFKKAQGIMKYLSELPLTFNKNGFAVGYYSLRLPIKMDSYHTIPSYRLVDLKKIRFHNRIAA